MECRRMGSRKKGQRSEEEKRRSRYVIRQLKHWQL
jgi:hypothetical protein